jgi:DNA-binding response OmpR family regulator
MEPVATPRGAEMPVAVLADDLIWASRLRAAIARAGGRAIFVRSVEGLEAAMRGGSAELAVIDLTALSYDGVEAVRTAASAGAAVLAVGQHDDLELRRRALAAGAKRVLSYNKLFNDGPQVMTRLIEAKL